MHYERFPLGNLWTNGYLFWGDGKEAFFVDPGGDVDDVLGHLARRNLTLKAVLLTHGHLDHIAGIEGLLPLVGNEVYISEEDAPLLRRPPEEIQRALGMTSKGTETFKTVSDKTVLSFGDLRVEVLATPGHTRGSVCYLIKDEKGNKESVLVSGDTLFAQSVGRTDLPGGDEAQLMESLRKLAELPDELPVLPGHGPGTAIGRERRGNPFWPRRG
jgi:glyoxylase-like metal-dependent hydrolase (beta-lactamase superfamily II)